MKDQDEFFSPKHKRLLTIATWAKYIAWLGLLVALMLPVARYVQIQNYYRYQSIAAGEYTDFVTELKSRPGYAVSVGIEVAQSFLSGLFYYLVLTGISLGLSMIVETDINYRERNMQGGAQ